MSIPISQFDNEQLNRLFPYFILIDENSKINEYGAELKTLIAGCKGKALSACFTANQSSINLNDFNALKANRGPVVITANEISKTTIEGQFELLNNGSQLLFASSRLLYNTDGSGDMALFSLQNPAPLLRVSTSGEIILQNPAAKALTAFYYDSSNYSSDEMWRHIAKNTDLIKNGWTFEAMSAGNAYCFFCKAQQGQDYFNVYGSDITQQKKNEEELLRLSLVASLNDSGVLFNDAKGKILWVNEGYCKMLGYTYDEIVGRSPLDFCRGPLTDDAILQNIGRSMGHTESFNDELIHYRKDGSWFWGRVKGQSYKSNNEQGLKYFSMIEDITLEKEKEDRLKVLSQIAESNINSVVITDKEGKITWVNKSFTDVTGFAIEEAAGKKPGHLLQGPDTDPITVAYLRKQVESGRPFNTEIYNYAKSGRGYWLRIQGQPILDAHGELMGFFALEEDITDEKEAQRYIKESETRFRMALEKIGDNVWEHNFKTKHTLFSKNNDELWGHKSGKKVDDGQLWWDSVVAEDLPMLKENYLKYQKGEIDSHNLEYRIIHCDGSVKWVMDRGVVIERDEEGKPVRVVGTHTDITKIKQTETELEQRVMQFKSLSDNIPGVIYEYEYREDGTEGLTYVSPAVQTLFGIKPDDFYNYLNFIDPADRERILKQNKYSQTTLDPFYAEALLNISETDSRWVAFQSSFSFIAQNGAKVFTGFMMDITERKNIEETLKSNEEKYRNIISNMNLGLLEVDVSEMISYANKSFCDMSGYSVSDLIGKKASALFANEKHAPIFEEKRRKREQGIADAYEIETRDKSGNKRWWLISGAPRYNDKGELVGSIGIHLDITDQKKQEAELIDARNQAEQLAKIKENFLANMSHEIRTPMNAIMGMSNQLAKTSLLPQQKFYLNTISTATDNLLIIINDILDLSKIEAGKLNFENIGFEPTRVANMAMQVLAPKAEEKGLKLNSSVFDNGISPVLMGDPYRLNQVLLNLMSNSIKFTEKGSVDIEFRLINDTPTTQLIKIIVSDTGIGMEQSFIKHLFDKFSQEYESVSRKFGGTGLGMSICKQLVNLMGGEIFVDSVKGKGTTISLVIEFKKGNYDDLPQKNIQQVTQTFLTGKKVLVVDDNELNRLVASIILQNYNADIKEAVNGEKALELVNQEDFDIILMDIQMPVLNGFDASKAIRQAGYNTPIIALTAAAIRGEREKCIEAGMNDYISKPFKEDEFLNIIDKWLSPGTNSAPAGESEDELIDGDPLYDLSTLHDISRGNESFVKKMVDMFCDQTPPMVKEMAEAYAAGNFEKMGAIAHKIKPSIDNLNISSLKTIVRNIETMSQDETADASLATFINDTDSIIAKVVAAMKKEYPDEVGG